MRLGSTSADMDDKEEVTLPRKMTDMLRLHGPRAAQMATEKTPKKDGAISVPQSQYGEVEDGCSCSLRMVTTSLAMPLLAWSWTWMLPLVPGLLLEGVDPGVSARVNLLVSVITALNRVGWCLTMGMLLHSVARV